MRPEEVLARRLAAEVESELSSLGALEAELAGAPSGDDTYALRARGSILHDFYNGIERVFVRIARELNGGVPQAEQSRVSVAFSHPRVRGAVIEGGADLILTCTLTTSVISFIPAYTVKIHADHDFLAQRTRPACSERSPPQRRQSVSGGPGVPGKASSQDSGHEASMAGHHRRSRE